MLKCKFAHFYSRKCRRKNLSLAIMEAYNIMILTNREGIIMRITSETSREYDIRWKIEKMCGNLFSRLYLISW